MARYPALSDHIRKALNSIQPSRDRGIEYFPCRATVKSGQIFDTVYIEPEIPYIHMWGVYPEEDKGKKSIPIEQILKIEDSPTRIPPQFANELYLSGESGMGYTIFTVLFSDGQKQAYVTGNAVDFIQYPPGKTPADVVAVIPHEGRNANPVGGPPYYWCLFSTED